MAYCASPRWLWWWRNCWNDRQGKPKYSDKTCSSAALPTTNPTCCLGANPDRRGGKPTTNRLSYGTAFSDLNEKWNDLTLFIKFSNKRKKGKYVYIPVTSHESPLVCERSRLPHFLDKRLTDGGKVVSPTRRQPFTPQVPFLRFLVLISVRGWVDRRAILRQEALGKLKKKSTSSGRDPATFRLVA
jgi:hypothetical protein